MSASGDAKPEAEAVVARRRMFFALWPTERTRVRILRATRRAVRGSGGRPTPAHNLHITLAFLGAVTDRQLERALAVPPIPAGVFELVLDTLGYWPRSRILWLAPRSIPAPLTALERELWAGLTEAGFEREARIFRPHLTLVRRGRAVREAVRPVRWSVRRLALVESVPEPGGSRYRPIRFWRLVS